VRTLRVNDVGAAPIWSWVAIGTGLAAHVAASAFGRDAVGLQHHAEAIINCLANRPRSHHHHKHFSQRVKRAALKRARHTPPRRPSSWGQTRIKREPTTLGNHASYLLAGGLEVRLLASSIALAGLRGSSGCRGASENRIDDIELLLLDISSLLPVGRSLPLADTPKQTESVGWCSGVAASVSTPSLGCGWLSGVLTESVGVVGAVWGSSAPALESSVAIVYGFCRRCNQRRRHVQLCSTL
jgi:hypothetical protein